MTATVFYEDVAEVALLTNTFLNSSGTPADPTTVSCTVTDPSGTAVVHTYGGTAPADITKPLVGKYTLAVSCLPAIAGTDGLWAYEWTGTGAVSDVQPGTWRVLSPALNTYIGYCGLEELKDRLGITDTSDDYAAQLAIQAASSWVTEYCGVHFNRITETRTFVPYCADLETEILTRSGGWCRYSGVQPGDEVLTLNVKTGLAEWQPLLAVNVFPGQHEVVRLKSGSHSSLTTPAHRWPVMIHGQEARGWQWRTTADAPGQSRILAAAPVMAPEPKWSDALVELMAWLWTEGTVTLSRGIRITQSERVNPSNVTRIREALSEVIGAPGGVYVRDRATWHEHNHDERGIVKFRLNQKAAEPLLAHAPDRIVSTAWLSELTRAQLELFIHVSLAADGCIGQRENGLDQWHMAQKDVRKLQAFQVACLLAGQSMEISGPDKHGMWHGTVRWVPWRTPWNHEKKPLRTVITEGVWCPTTGNGTWFARRDGTTYATGNSIWDITFDPLVTITALNVDQVGQGVYAEAWVLNVDYQLKLGEDLYNINAAGVQRPYRKAQVLQSGKWFPYTYPYSHLDRVQIIGTWGWPSVPPPVAQATLILAARLFKSKDAPFGVAGVNDFGVVRVQTDPWLTELLRPYTNMKRKVGV